MMILGGQGWIKPVKAQAFKVGDKFSHLLKENPTRESYQELIADVQNKSSVDEHNKD